jgi:predicted transcriptional regulator
MEEVKNYEERKRIGEHLMEVRRGLGITQQKLAERSGIKQANIARIECGKYNSTFDTLTVLAGAMGKRIDIV